MASTQSSVKRNLRRRTVTGFEGVSRYKNRHGKIRYRFRRNVAGNRVDHTFKSLFGTDAFAEEYDAVVRGVEYEARKEAEKREHTGHHTVKHLLEVYYGSPKFKNLNEATQKNYRSQLRYITEEHGDDDVADLSPSNIEFMMGEMAPTRANNFLKRMKTLMKIGIREKMITVDPTIGVDPIKIKSKGHHSWTEEEVAKFEAVHPIGTQARLALALLLYFGQRRSDIVRIGKQHIRRGVLTLRQQKTDNEVNIPVHPELQRVIDHTEIPHMNFLTTAYGKPFTSNGFGNKMRDWCNKAGLPHCSAHGLRKAAGVRLAEAGCTSKQIQAILGHESLAESEKYVEAANRKKLAVDAIAKITPIKEVGS